MRRTIVAGTTAALIVAIGAVGISPAAAAPPTDPWDGSAGGEVVSLTTDAVGLQLADLGVAVSDATVDSQVDPQAVSTSSNISADVAGLGLTVSSNSQSAPPDAGGPAAGNLVGVTVPTLLDVEALTTTNEAHWGLDTACVTDGVLSSAFTQTAGLSLLPLLGGGVLDLGVSSTTGETSLVQNLGLNYGVQSVATGNIEDLSLLGGQVAIDIDGDTTLTATATGTSAGTVDYAPATVSVTALGDTVVLTPGEPTVSLSIPLVADVTITLNTPTISTTATSATATSSLLTIEVSVLGVFPLPPVAEVSVDVLPLSATATAPSGGIDCPPPPPVILVPAEGATTDSTPVISGTASSNAFVTVLVDGASVGGVAADGDGNWSLTPTVPLAEGPHVATAIQTVAGTPSAPSEPVNFTVDATAPPAPLITDPENGDLLNDTTPPISGTAEANSIVEVFVDDISIGTTTASGTGAWSLSPTTPLSDGTHSTLATATDAVGNVSPDSNLVTFTIDATAPAPPVITDPENGDVTSDTTPTITGTSEPNAFITVSISGTGVGATNADGAGNWTFTPLIPLADGEHTVVATATDAADNTSLESNTVTFTVDTTAPVAPVITAPVDGSSTNDTTPDIVGTAEANSTVTVTIDGVEAGTADADGAGNWTFTPGAALPAGDHTVVATATDEAGNVSPDSNEVTFTIDLIAPVAPVITDPDDDAILADNTPDIIGTAEADTTVEVFIDGASVGTTTASGTGAWTFTPTTPLGDGEHTVFATATDEAGNTSGDSNTVTFTVDTAAPAVPIITAPENDSIIADNTPDIIGTAEANATVEVFIDGASVGTTVAAGTGAWTLSLTTPLAEGVHTATATATDAAGNGSLDSAPVTFTVDTLDPAAPVITSPDEGDVTSDPTPPIVGTAEANTTVTVVIDGDIIGTAPVDGLGSWSLTPTTPLDDGPHTVTATAEDAAGNVSPGATPVNFTVDTAAPAAPVITAPADGSSTNHTTPDIVGTAEGNATVEVFIDGTSVGTTTADDTGDWTLLLTAPLAEGPHTAVAVATDAGGTESPESEEVTFTVDTTAPVAPVVIAPADGSTIADTTPDVAGTAEPNVTVNVSIDGVPVGTTTSGGTGAWTFPTTTALAQGPHTASATATDAAGNTGPVSNTVTFTVDSIAPIAPVITAPADGSSTSSTTPPVIGTAEANSTVTVTIDGVVAGTAPVSGGGAWTFTPPTPLAEGEHTASATSTDAAGNVSPVSNEVAFTVDTVAPAAPVVVSPADGSVINDTTPSVTGTAEANSTVTVFIDGALAGTTAADGAGNWTFQSGALAEGSHTVRATATDAAGNESASSATNTFEIDLTAPAAPIIVSPADGSSTTDSTPAITGTAEPNSTVTVTIDGEVAGTTTADGSGNWTFTPSTPLTDGEHTATATATDEAGNESPDSNAVTFTVDASAPAAPVITSPEDGSSTADTTPAVVGTAEPGSTVTVTIDGEVAGTTTADGSGNWTFTPSTPLGEGEHTVTATATDDLGNTGPASAPVDFTVDTTPPAAPVITSPADGSTTTDPTPPITGTAEPGSEVTVIVDGNPIGTTTTDEDGNWTFIPTAPLPDGEHELTAMATDAAGNVGTASEPVTVTIDTRATPPGDGDLPATGGTSPLTLLLLGSLLVALGAGLFAVRHRRA